MAYKILEASDMRELEKLVNGAAAMGWKPLGGVAVLPYVSTEWNRDFEQREVTSYPTYLQAMTRNDAQFGKAD